ncbi:MAG TPA: FtsX-like permease family protein, partial [Puia sp.]|nr:FtsX-like permease family protein [Puia sp.]
MTESFLVTVVSVTIAILLLTLCLPGFNELTGKRIPLPFHRFSFWLGLLGLTCVTAFIAGIYPALFLSSFRPLSVLKPSATRPRSGTGWLRKGLVVFQFTLSILLIIGTLVVSRQVDYIQSRNIGYDKNDLIYVPIEGNLSRDYDYLKEAAGKSPGIASISFISDDPDYLDNNSTDISWEGKPPGKLMEAAEAEVKLDFVQTMKLSLAAGRDFSASFPTDSSAWIINETAAREMGYSHPIGRTLTMWGRKGRIIGVVRDFNFKPVHERIRPLILSILLRPKAYGTLLVRARPGQTRQALATLQSLCTTLNPAFPFTYQFSVDAYLSSYKNEIVIRSLADGFATLAILISCLGLLGLAAFTAERRTKEISIRKVLGANVLRLFLMVCSEFIALVALALALAIPLSLVLMNNWLDNYAYRTSIAWWIFALGGGVAVLITLLTIGYQALRLASTSPIRSLRTE